MCLEMTSKPNILIIVTDDQGYGDLTAFKHHLPEGLDGQAIPKEVTTIADQRDLFWCWGDSYAVRSGDWKLLHSCHR